MLEGAGCCEGPGCCSWPVPPSPPSTTSWVGAGCLRVLGAVWVSAECGAVKR